MEATWIWMLLAAETGGANSWCMLPSFLAIIFLFYLLFIRSESKKRAQHEEMIRQLKKNDRVVTIGGIYGTVASVSQEKDEIVLRVDENTNTKIRVSRRAIAQVLKDDQDSKDSSS